MLRMRRQRRHGSGQGGGGELCGKGKRAAQGSGRLGGDARFGRGRFREDEEDRYLSLGREKNGDWIVKRLPRHLIRDGGSI
jgi:hypothetical protein